MQPVDPYLETRVMTASPEQLHLMVVDAAIRHSRKAEQALTANDYEVSFMALTKARECVDELLTSLDPTQAPEVTENVKQLFLFVHRNLRLADLQRDPQKVRGALKILEMHRETWQQLLQRLAETGGSQRPVEVRQSGFSFVT